jgi:hypothetical protein
MGRRGGCPPPQSKAAGTLGGGTGSRPPQHAVGFHPVQQHLQEHGRLFSSSKPAVAEPAWPPGGPGFRAGLRLSLNRSSPAAIAAGNMSVHQASLRPWLFHTQCNHPRAGLALGTSGHWHERRRRLAGRGGRKQEPSAQAFLQSALFPRHVGSDSRYAVLRQRGRGGLCPGRHPLDSAGPPSHAHGAALHAERRLHVPNSRHDGEAAPSSAGGPDQRDAVVRPAFGGPGARSAVARCMGKEAVLSPPACPPRCLARPRRRSLGQPSAGVLAKAGGLHAFVGMPRWPMLATNRDATLQEYGIGKPSNNSGCYVLTHSGGQMVRRQRRGSRAPALAALVWPASRTPKQLGHAGLRCPP